MKAGLSSAINKLQKGCFINVKCSHHLLPFPRFNSIKETLFNIYICCNHFFIFLCFNSWFLLFLRLKPAMVHCLHPNHVIQHYVACGSKLEFCCTSFSITYSFNDSSGRSLLQKHSVILYCLSVALGILLYVV